MSLVDEMQRPGVLWVFELAPDNRRVAAEIFEHPLGVVFADIGWNLPDRSAHSFHVVIGELKSNGAGYRIGHTEIVELDESDPLAYEGVAWTEYMSKAGQREAARETCFQAMQADGII